MKNYALLNENNVVINISIADNDWDSTGWIEYTSINPAHIGGDYLDGFFYPPKPYPSWVRNLSTYLWESPVAMPTDDKRYTWNEVTTSWIEVAE